MHASDCLYRPLHATLRGSSPVSSGSRAALRLSTASAVWSPRFCGPSNATAQYFSEVLRRIRARRGVVGRQPVEARPSSGAGRGRRACAPSPTCLRPCTQGRVVGLAPIGEQRREPGAKRRASRRADDRPPRDERRADARRSSRGNLSQRVTSREIRPPPPKVGPPQTPPGSHLLVSRRKELLSTVSPCTQPMETR